MPITRANLRVENHQPVPLVPLVELPYAGGAPVYLGKIVNYDGEVYGQEGWFMWDDGLSDFISLEALGNGSVNENLESFGLNEDTTMARTLQPGERLVIEFESI